MQIKLFHKEISLALIVFVFKKLHCLPQIAVNILNFPLAMAVVYCHLYLYSFVWIVQNLINFCEQVNVVLGAETVEAPSALNIALEVKVLGCQSFNRLLLNSILLVLGKVLRLSFPPLLHV
jgi:protein gp37